VEFDENLIDVGIQPGYFEGNDFMIFLRNKALPPVNPEADLSATLKKSLRRPVRRPSPCQ